MRDLGNIMALAHHEPAKIHEATQSKGDLMDQAESLGLETGNWWEEDFDG